MTALLRLVRPTCESCGQRQATEVVVVDGEPFHVCGPCVLPEPKAAAS